MRVFAWLTFFFFTSVAGAEEYEVLPHAGDGPRGILWVADGPARFADGGVANRFRLGAGLELGKDRRFTVGLVILDSFSKAEKSRDVGGVTRSGSGILLGYDLLADRLNLAYVYNMQGVRGDRVTGSVAANGHELALTHKLWSGEQWKLGAQLSYLMLKDVTVPVLDAASNTVQNATFPGARIATLSLVFAYAFN